MLILDFTCPNPKCRAHVEHVSQGDESIDGFQCPQCGRRGLTLERMEICVSAFIARRLGVIERRLEAVEKCLTDVTADSDEPFEAESVQ